MSRRWSVVAAVALFFSYGGFGCDPTQNADTLDTSGTSTSRGDLGYPASYTELLGEIADQTQTDPSLGLVNGGEMSCASVSVTNSLAWLEDQGYAGLLVMDAGGRPSFSETAKELDRILGIPANKGAPPPSLMRGVSCFLTQQGFPSHELRFQGWYQPSGNAPAEEYPNLETLKTAIVNGAAVWLFVGFYEYEADTDRYVVISHHYVTLAGYDQNTEGDILIVHDPAPRAGLEVSHDRVSVERINSGKITVDPTDWFAKAYYQLPKNAAGYFRLGGDLKLNPYANAAILDGVIILHLETNEAEQSQY